MHKSKSNFMEVVTKKISELKLNTGQIEGLPKNPRLIKDDKFKKLCKSIEDFPEMLSIRPIVVNSDMVILGGNMRYRACKEIGYKEIPVVVAENMSIEKQREFLVKDNVAGGEWDWDLLANEWNEDELNDWGLDVWNDKDGEEDEDEYTKKIVSPVYEITGDKPKLNELYDREKYDNLVDKIYASDIDDDIKLFLQFSAGRHIVFDYQNIAEYYAHATPEVQELMEESALVIIDFEKAIELGYVKLADEIKSEYLKEHGNEA